MVGLSVFVRAWSRSVVAGTCLLIGVGCNLDIASGSDGAASDTDVPPSSGPTGTGDDPTQGTGANATEPEDEESGESGTAGPMGDTDDFRPCELDCGADGWCEVDEDGHAQCTCDEGYASTGLQCVPCTAVEGTLDADVPIVDAVIELEIENASPPAMIQESGRVFLRNTSSGDEVYLGSTYEGLVTKTIVPGMYEVYYSRFQGGAAVPANRNALVGTMLIDDAEPLVIDIPMATVTGSFTIAGETPTDSPYDYGRVFLVDRASGDEVLLGATRDREFVVNVIPGDYEVRYRLGQAEAQAPLNRDARIGTVRVHAQSEGLQNLEIDIPAVDVQGAIRVNGGTPPGVVQDYGRIVFVDASTGDRTQVGTTRDGTYAARLVSGDYDVFYEKVAGGIAVPVNQHALLQKLALTASGVVDIDVPAVPISGVFTVAGDSPPTSASDDGVVMLRNDTGDVALLGNTHDVSFDALVVPGEYQVYYAQETAGAVMPSNTNAFVRDLNVQGEGTRTIDIPVAHISGSLAVSGGVPPDSVYDDGRVYLRNRATGDSVLLGNTRLAQYQAAVVPGTYDVVYEAEISDAVMPVNKAAVIMQNVVVAPGTSELAIDVPVAQVAGQIRIADAPPPSGGEEVGNLYLEDVHSADLIWLGSTKAPSFVRPLAPGRYLLRYRGNAAGDALPANANAGISCFDVTQ